jgi:sulfur-oxidizing protein SoxZ
MAKPRLKVPKTAAAGEVVTIKTLIDHKMDSGQAKDKEGNLIPRKIINTFSASFNGVEVIRVNLEPAISTNPYFQFSFKVPETGDLAFKWVDDDGTVTEATKTITVE